MEKAKFWRLKLKGSLSLDDAQAAVADREGTLLRVHSEKGETHVYFSSTGEALEKRVTEKMQAGALEEVSLEDVSRISAAKKR
jgi:hypothetical protein